MGKSKKYNREFQLQTGRLVVEQYIIYLSLLFSWRLSNTMEADFCIDALEDALRRYGQPEIFNTDPATPVRRSGWRHNHEGSPPYFRRRPVRTSVPALLSRTY